MQTSSPSPTAPTTSRRASRAALTALAWGSFALLVAFAACDPSTHEEPVPRRVLANDGAIESSVVVAEGGGACSLDCGDGGACCNNACTAPAWDPESCGSCGVSCNAASTTGHGSCVQGACIALGPVGGTSVFTSKPADVVLSGSVLYADLPAAGASPISAIDLGAAAPFPRAVPISPTMLPIADGRGGIYAFEKPASGHLLVLHYDYASNLATQLDDLGAGAYPHLLVRQGNSVARVFSPTIGILRTVCANGTVHDLMQSSGVAYGAADDGAVYFGFGSPITPAVRVSCDPGGAVTELPTTFGHVVAVDVNYIYWFGMELTMDAASGVGVAGIYASPRDGATKARLIVRLPATSSLVTFPLFFGSTLYFVSGDHLPSGTPINVLSWVDVSSGAAPPSATVHAVLSSASPIALDPAFAYTTIAAGAGELVVRMPLSP